MGWWDIVKAREFTGTLGDKYDSYMYIVDLLDKREMAVKEMLLEAFEAWKDERIDVSVPYFPLQSGGFRQLGMIENLKFTPGGAVIGGDGAYWAGSTFSDTGNTNSSPNAIRIYGVWSGNHIESGAPFHLKFYVIQQFNKDGKVVALNEWFDPSSIQVQIDEYLKNKK